MSSWQSGVRMSMSSSGAIGSAAMTAERRGHNGSGGYYHTASGRFGSRRLGYRGMFTTTRSPSVAALIPICKKGRVPSEGKTEKVSRPRSQEVVFNI